MVSRDPSIGDPLHTYRSKRSPGATPEPFGSAMRTAGGIFVVQKHAATRLHYDLRLEYDGVLMSFAVPAGPSLDPSDKRFAVHTEDHPLEYADFEGVIPKGEYGGGEMIVWDRGAMRWAEEPGPGLENGKLLFDLTGYKLNGRWTLVRMKKESEWLLIKKPDQWATDQGTFDEGSILTGRTIEDLASGDADIAEILASIDSAPASNVSIDEPMLAETAPEPFSDPGWVFEIKYDGYRLIADKRESQVTLRYRSGLDATDLYPEIAGSIAHIPYDTALIDGELVVSDSSGVPDFKGLQRRAHLSDPGQIRAASVAHPTSLFAFDLLELDGRDLRAFPLIERKAILSRIVPALGPVRYADHIAERGEAVYAQVERMGLEGVVAKRADSMYSRGRSDAWRKIRVEHEDAFAIVGYTNPKGGRAGIGALHIAYERDGALTYGGRVGSGFSDADLVRFRETLAPDAVPMPRCTGATPEGPENTWVEPTLACHVRYKEITDDGALRHPVYLGVLALDNADVLSIDGPPSQEPPEPAVEATKAFEATNLDKVFWPNEGYTKGDLIAYYEAVGDHLLPYLADRPLVMDRYPDGIEGKSFFQKNAAPSTPRWIRVERVETREDKGNDYFVIDGIESLRYIANLASIPLHVWASRLTDIDTPDWCILDLDPKDAPFTSVVVIARRIKELCDEIHLPVFVKTSGKSGLHVLVPMGPGFSYDQQKLLGELIARVIEADLPTIATTERLPSQRGGKVYIDYLQNGKGKLLVAPYSVRPVAGATVSAPLKWDEVDEGLSLGDHTIRTMPERLATLAIDPFLGVLSERPDVRSSLQSLAAHLPS